jgi:glycosyltransferase involved in cell wall biosynthesis
MKPFIESTLTVVTPVYLNEATLEELARLVFAVAGPRFASVEYVFVNDGSPDGSRQILKRMSDADGRVKAINLARNFGQHVALMVGMKAAAGDYVLVIDGDLEESPSDLPAFMEKMREGFEIVVGERVNRRRTMLRALLSRCYTNLFNALSDHKMLDNLSDMRLMTCRYVSYLTSFTERPFIAGITSWIGLPIGLVPVSFHERQASGYSFRRLLRHARMGILGFSNKPIRVATALGLTLCAASVLYGLWILALYFLRGGIAAGFTTIVILFGFLMGAQFVFIGLLGEYIGEIFLGTKNRPSHLVYDRFGFGD